MGDATRMDENLFDPRLRAQGLSIDPSDKSQVKRAVSIQHQGFTWWRHVVMVLSDVHHAMLCVYVTGRDHRIDILA